MLDYHFKPPLDGLSPQNRLIIEYLSATPERRITNLIALANLGIGSLTSRIAELRQRGWNIEDETKHDHSGALYKSYRLVLPDASYTQETKIDGAKPKGRGAQRS